MPLVSCDVPEATVLVADTVCEAARDGRRLAEAIEQARAVLGPEDVLPGVADVVTEVHVEAVFDDGSRLAVVTDPIGGGGRGGDAPGALLPAPQHTEPEPVEVPRGDDWRAAGSKSAGEGPSPRARGRPAVVGGDDVDERTTPAGAGTTRLPGTP
ncbi:hypothetical protein GCM10010273_55660 [Streptomyces lavendulocolor]